VNSKLTQVRIWELATDYQITAEEARRALAVGGLYRSSTNGLVPDADARRILGKPGGNPFNPPKRKLTDWDREFIPSDDVMDWRDGGVHEARIAVKAMQAGLSPSDMKIKLDGVSVGQRLANGEPVAWVKSRLRELEGTGC
jgi:hypothetical protein